jgi:hypothetical protein
MEQTQATLEGFAKEGYGVLEETNVVGEFERMRFQ